MGVVTVTDTDCDWLMQVNLSNLRCGYLYHLPYKTSAIDAVGSFTVCEKTADKSHSEKGHNMVTSGTDLFATILHPTDPKLVMQFRKLMFTAR